MLTSRSSRPQAAKVSAFQGMLHRILVIHDPFLNVFRHDCRLLRREIGDEFAAIFDVRLAQELPPDIFTGPGHDDALRTRAGIAASRLQGIQRQLLESLIDEYLDNMHPEVARSHRRKIQEDGFDALHFAWMGPSLFGKPVHYRVHGPSLLMEYDNSLAVGTETRSTIRITFTQFCVCQGTTSLTTGCGTIIGRLDISNRRVAFSSSMVFIRG